MFDLFGEGPPEDWEPIPASVFAEIGPWGDEEDLPAGLVPVSSGPDDLVWQALSRSLGADTLPLLTATPYEALTDQGRSLALRRLDELSAHLEAVKAELTGLIAGPKPATAQPLRDEFSAHEVSVATRCSVYAADAKIAFARDLAGRLTATLEAMHRGEITWAQARALSEATCHLDVDTAREIEAKLLRFCHRQDLSLFKASLRRWLAKLDPEFTPRATAARKECMVEHTANGDGTGELFLRGPLEITAAIHTALTGYAATTKPQLGGTAAQRKLAGLRDVIDRYLGSAEAPTHHGRIPTVTVTIDLATLLGLRDGIAEIPGVGAIPASAARWLLADGAPLRRLVTDPLTGALLDYGRSTYLVPPALAEFLCAKNITSASPHSNIDSRLTDMEHNQPHHHGGTTDPINTPSTGDGTAPKPTPTGPTPKTPTPAPSPGPAPPDSAAKSTPTTTAPGPSCHLVARFWHDEDGRVWSCNRCFETAPCIAWRKRPRWLAPTTIGAASTSWRVEPGARLDRRARRGRSR